MQNDYEDKKGNVLKEHTILAYLSAKKNSEVWMPFFRRTKVSKSLGYRLTDLYSNRMDEFSIRDIDFAEVTKLAIERVQEFDDKRYKRASKKEKIAIVKQWFLDGSPKYEAFINTHSLKYCKESLMSWIVKHGDRVKNRLKKQGVLPLPNVNGDCSYVSQNQTPTNFILEACLLLINKLPKKGRGKVLLGLIDKIETKGEDE